MEIAKTRRQKGLPANRERASRLPRAKALGKRPGQLSQGPLPFAPRLPAPGQFAQFHRCTSRTAIATSLGAMVAYQGHRWLQASW